jgi:hypothetical protein
LASLARSLCGTLTFKLDYWYHEETPPWLILDSYLSRLPARYWPLGFHRYLSYRRWFRRPLADYLRDQLAGIRVRQNPLWNQAFLRNLAMDQVLHGPNRVREINLVLTMDAVERLLLRQWIDETPTPPVQMPASLDPLPHARVRPLPT